MDGVFVGKGGVIKSMTEPRSHIVLISASEETGLILSNLVREHLNGGRLSTFQTLEQAIRAMDTTPADSIVIEADGDGAIDICRRLRDSDTHGHVPRLWMSRNGEGVAAAAMALAAGADDVNVGECVGEVTVRRLELLCRLKQSDDRRRSAEHLLEELTVRHREALISSERRYRRLVEISPDTIAVCTDGSVTFINEAGKRLLHADHLDDLLEKPILDLVHADSKEVMSRIIGSCVDGDEHIPFVLVKMKAKDGTVVQAEAAAVRFDDVDHRHVLLVMRDVGDRTELSEKFRQAQRMEAVGQLAGGVAHDFNNILTTIRGYSDLILDSLNAEDPLVEDVREIKDATGRAGALTRQLLAFSRRQVLDPAPLDINRVVVNLKRMLQRMIGDHIELDTELEPDLGIVKADRSQIEQVLMNLAVNARDAMPDGGVVTIRTHNYNLETLTEGMRFDLALGPYLVIEVMDTGIGMSPETAFHIFEPFFTTKAKDKGTGLGLSTVYGIVKQSGGDIVVDSEVDKGTTFKVFLPVAPDLVAAMAPVRTEQGPAKGSETILLVEDDKTVRYLTKRLLERAGYNVLLASHGGEALFIAGEHKGPIHILVTDVVMPEMGGLQLVSRLLEQHPYMKAIMMSGYTDKEVVAFAEKLPGAAFLQKPFSYEELTTKVRLLLDSNDA
jgi:two-component system, cell cycle sensor histidine kinase and response regulator CckA